eukprot:scaffold13234_cov36-Tisochrysis_lutea.AAC.5
MALKSAGFPSGLSPWPRKSSAMAGGVEPMHKNSSSTVGAACRRGKLDERRARWCPRLRREPEARRAGERGGAHERHGEAAHLSPSAPPRSPFDRSHK